MGITEELKAKMKARVELANAMQSSNISDTSKRYYQGIEEVSKEVLKILDNYKDTEIVTTHI